MKISERWHKAAPLATLSLSMLMPSLETSIANAGLPTLAKALNASFQEVQWIVLAYLLVMTTMIVSIGRLGDLIGRRRLLLGGLLLFTSASLLCGLANSLWPLVAARAAQGLGAATMIALTLAMVGETVPKEKIGSAMGLLGTMSALGTTLGPSLGGLLITGLGWQTIFLINVPLGILNILLILRYLPSDHSRRQDSTSDFDLIGMILLAVTLASYALAMTMGRFTGLALAGGVLFVLHEIRTSTPLIDLKMFRNSALTSALLMSTVVATVMMTTLVVGPFYLSLALELKPASVGFALSAGPLVAALTGIPAGRIVDAWGARRMTLMGLVGIALGALLLAISSRSLGIAGYLAPIAVMTGSYALFQAANNTQVMTGIPPAQRGVISGLLSLSRNLGLITGTSAMGAIFVVASKTTDLTRTNPDAVAQGMRLTFLVATFLLLLTFVIATLIRRMPIKVPNHD